jgi:major type 1 subunit fimbrin (pilin)
MNKFSVRSLVAALALAGLSQAALANDGEITFKGNITATTCAIQVIGNTGGIAGEVALGDVQASSLAGGQSAGGGAFSLKVDDSSPGCDISGKKATVTFLAMSGVGGASGEFLGVEKNVGYAENVAIQLKDAKGTQVNISEPSSEYLDLTEAMRFTANYIGLGGTVKEGHANGKAGFTVSIQ